MDYISYQSTNKMGMVLKELQKYNITECQVRRSGDGKYHIFILHKNKITDIGTVIPTRDNRWKIDNLYLKTLNNL